ncbi:MAG: four helix bundle protein [Patescibacteria group bacterium]
MESQTSNFKIQSSKKLQTPSSKRVPFDLEGRMAKFGEEIIIFCRGLNVDHVSRPIVTQLVRSATSIGANYCEANNASSKKDFRNKVHIAKKETQETKHWLRMLKPCYPNRENEIKAYWQEAHEITLILQSIVNNLKIKVDI